MVIRINLKQSWKPVALGLDRPNRDPRELLGQLTHWAAHTAAGISPAAEGRYHSRDFGGIAEKLGPKVRQARGVGWAPEPAKSPSSQ